MSSRVSARIVDVVDCWSGDGDWSSGHLLGRFSRTTRKSSSTPPTPDRPKAVHELRKVHDEIAQEQQVVITTHSPLLVGRGDVSGNIIIQENRAVQATSLTQIRDVLGVRVADNLQSANVVLLVEGYGDKRIITTFLNRRSKAISSALSNGTLRIECTTGAPNVAYQYRLYYDGVCRVHALLDNDGAGRKALEALEKEPGFRHQDATVVSVVGMNESEMEDLFVEEYFGELIFERFNVVLRAGVTHPAKKFTARMKDYFSDSGQAWTRNVGDQLKTLVADGVEHDPDSVLRADRTGPLDALVRAPPTSTPSTRCASPVTSGPTCSPMSAPPTTGPTAGRTCCAGRAGPTTSARRDWLPRSRRWLPAGRIHPQELRPRGSSASPASCGSRRSEP